MFPEQVPLLSLIKHAFYESYHAHCCVCSLSPQDDYVIGKELGRGRFSVVCECVNKETGQHAAVKIIDKSTIEPEEKGLLRTEIAGT